MTEQAKCANDIEMIINALQKRFSLKTGVAVGNFLDLSKYTVYEMRKGKVGLSIESRLIIIDALNCYGIENLSEKITEKYLSKRIIEIIGKSVGKNKSLIDLFKIQQAFKTDETMAQFIGLKRTSLSMVRKGKSGLGPLPRLKILSIIDDVSLDEVEKGLASNEKLLRMIVSKENYVHE